MLDKHISTRYSRAKNRLKGLDTCQYPRGRAAAVHYCNPIMAIWQSHWTLIVTYPAAENLKRQLQDS